MTTSHCTCYGCCVRDYHISFWLFALSNPSVLTLCLKDPRIGGWQNSAGSSAEGQVIWMARLSSNSKNWENPLLNNENVFFFFSLKHVCETINNKPTIFAFLAKKEERISREEEWRCGVVRMTVMSLKSGTLDFCKVWRLFGVPWVYNGRDASLAVLSLLLVYFLILSDDSFYHPILIDQYLD